MSARRLRGLPGSSMFRVQVPLREICGAGGPDLPAMGGIPSAKVGKCVTSLTWPQW